VKQIALDGEAKMPGHQYYLQDKSEAELKRWIKKPFGNVPENLLPAIKAMFLCYTQENRNELLALLNNRIAPAVNRKDPSLKEFMEAMDDFVKKCKANPNKRFLLFQLFAGHGYHSAGNQEVLG
jgi:hypothetical protein